MIKSLHLVLPKDKRFSGDNWFENFVGNFVLPILDTGKLHQYWFSRYEDNGTRHVRFRFTIDNYKSVQPLVKQLIKKYNLIDLKDEEKYNLVHDLGSQRFRANKKQKNNRAQLIFNYLYSIAVLYVDCLREDKKGNFHLEKNKNYNNPHGSIFESLHHLFCNMTDVKTYVIKCRIGGKVKGYTIFTSELYVSYYYIYALNNKQKFKVEKIYEIKF